ncbi:MAG TPA: hypothetical protein VEJ87_10800 [Acidimicrobiales bacterium]|nr:hypothetical protein [Acidimicrobiales bacterium]
MSRQEVLEVTSDEGREVVARVDRRRVFVEAQSAVKGVADGAQGNRQDTGKLSSFHARRGFFAWDRPEQ